MTALTKAELGEGVVKFDNSHSPSEESFEIELDKKDNSWGETFYLWENGELIATYRSFNGLKSRAEKIININGLERA